MATVLARGKTRTIELGIRLICFGDGIGVSKSPAAYRSVTEE